MGDTSVGVNMRWEEDIINVKCHLWNLFFLLPPGKSFSSYFKELVFFIENVFFQKL